MFDSLFEPPLRTAGRHILDARNDRFKLCSVNWYGGSDELFVPGGLDVRHRHDIATLIRTMGFNSVRLPYSDELVVRDPVIAPEHLAANPDLVGMRGLEVFEAVATACTDVGLAVIVNDHITQAGWCDGKNLCDAGWSNDHLGPLCRVRQTEDQWLRNWEKMMARFVHNPRIVGADLRNEPRGLWGTTSWSGWAQAATRGGNALLKLQPNWLIIVEGIGSANHLAGVRDEPVVLTVPHRVVYSVHVFPWSGWGSMVPYSKRPYPSFELSMIRNWGYLLDQNIAPVWVGEMGASRNPGRGDAHYWDNLIKWLGLKDADFGYWAINPRKPHRHQEEHWSLVGDDWATVVDDYRLQGMRTLVKQYATRLDPVEDGTPVVDGP